MTDCHITGIIRGRHETNISYHVRYMSAGVVILRVCAFICLYMCVCFMKASRSRLFLSHTATLNRQQERVRWLVTRQSSDKEISWLVLLQDHNQNEPNFFSLQRSPDLTHSADPRTQATVVTACLFAASSESTVVACLLNNHRLHYWYP